MYWENMSRNTEYEKECVLCFEKYTAKVNNTKYCPKCRNEKSKAGRGKDPATKLKTYNYKEKACDMCGGFYKPTSAYQKHCASCRLEAKRIRDKESSKRKKQSKTYANECEVCRKTFMRSGNNHKYCKDCGNLGEHRRVAFKERYPNWKCDRCGWDSWESRSELQIHHKDRNPKNNNPMNLEMLCTKCHRYEHTVQDIKTGKIITNL